MGTFIGLIKIWREIFIKKASYEKKPSISRNKLLSWSLSKHYQHKYGEFLWRDSISRIKRKFWAFKVIAPKQTKNKMLSIMNRIVPKKKRYISSKVFVIESFYIFQINYHNMKCMVILKRFWISAITYSKILLRYEKCWYYVILLKNKSFKWMLSTEVLLHGYVVFFSSIVQFQLLSPV